MRRKQATKRKYLKDICFENTVITRAINQLMIDGKKSIARRIFYRSLSDATKEVLQKQEVVQDEQLQVFFKLFENVKPQRYTCKRKFGAVYHQIPRDVRPSKQESFGLKEIVKAARKEAKSKGVKIHKALTDVLVQSYENKGDAVKAKEDRHAAARDNAVFGHFRW